MKLLRIVLAVLILFVAICLLIVGSLVVFVDPNKIKPVIAQEVMKRTGYQLAIEGQLKWTFYPLLGVKVEHATLAKPKQPVFADLRNVKIATEIMQIVRRKETLTGNVYIGEMRLAQIRAQDAQVTLAWQQKHLTLAPISAKLYGGKLNGTVEIANLTAMPEMKWQLHLNDVDLQGLLEDLDAANKLKMSGRAAVDFTGTSNGKNATQILSHLNGDIKMNVAEGKLKGIDLNYLFQSADALINRKSISDLNSQNQTAFSHFAGSAVITNGIATTDNLLLQADAFSVAGTGKINLVSQALDMRLTLKPSDAARTQWLVPVLVNGAFANPNVYLDISALQKYIVKQEVEQAKTKVTDEIKERIQGKAGEVLQNILGR